MKKNPLSVAVVFLLILSVDCRFSAVPESSGEAGPGICGELAGSGYAPVDLAELLCVARDSAGTFFVIDEYDYSYRCFISSGDTLQRIKVLGSGVFGEKYYFISLEGPRQLIFKNTVGAWSGVRLCRSGRCEKCDSILNSAMDSSSRDIHDLDTGWERMCQYLADTSLHCPALAVAAESEIDKYIPRNFPPVTRVEYLAGVPEEQYLLVTRVEYDWKGDVVVHYGPADDLRQRVVTRFLRARDGGSTWIRFMIGSDEAEVFFGVALDTAGIHESKSWLAVRGDTISIERVAPEARVLKDLGIECVHDIR